MTQYPDGPAGSPGFLLWHTTLRWQRSLAAALGPLGLTHVQFVLLACAWWLDEQGTEPNQIALAARAGTDVKMTSQVLRTLEDKRLLVRRTDLRDTRAKVVSITGPGKRLARRAVEVVERADNEFFAMTDTSRLMAVLRDLNTSADPPGA